MTNPIKRLRSILSEKGTIIDMDDFLLNLYEKDLISVSQENDIKKMKNYSEKMYAIFTILLGKNPSSTQGKLLNVIEAMHREDIIDRWENDSAIGENPISRRDFLLANEGILKEHMNVEVVSTELFNSGVLSQADLDEIMTPREKREKRTVLWTKLLTKIDPRNFEMLLQALTKAKQKDVTEELRSQERSISRGKPNIENDLLNSIPSDEDLRRIAPKLKESWHEWESLGRELGLGSDAIDRIKSKRGNHNSECPMRTTYLLLREWKKSSPKDRPSTFRALHEALCNQGMDTSGLIALLCRKNCDDIKECL
ncbi:unnamed protein product [Darwinula stevensoni]|uniref:Death domain-containing protein n=1 Tax=Darwinula stevensoni TaxID=69355 RepID=A0A7R8XHB3_9CRUS|nr:unnamed protein product [Darwinula stevensoni]CAG0893348.1 unnamed protein product [Darwinula stevensoni]